MRATTVIILLTTLHVGLRSGIRTKKNSLEFEENASALSGFASPEQEIEVVFIRHGKSFWNANEVHGAWTSLVNKVSGLSEETLEAFKDAPLVSRGVEQATNLQQWLYDHYNKIDAKKIQLAGSGLSRAYDTMVVATAPLWSSWNVTDFKVHMVPSLMEFGNIDTSRKSDRADDDPVDKRDSIFGPKSSTTYKNLEKHLGNACEKAMHDYPGWSFFYTDKASDVAAESVVVQSAYARHHVTSSCNPDQIAELEKYLADVAASGKTLIIAGTHSQLIRCAAENLPIHWTYASKSGSEPSHKVDHQIVTIDEQQNVKGILSKPRAIDITKTKLPNGGLLTLKMKLTPVTGDHIVCKRVLEYSNGDKVCLEFYSPRVTQIEAPKSVESEEETVEMDEFKQGLNLPLGGIVDQFDYGEELRRAGKKRKPRDIRKLLSKMTI